MKKDYHAGQKVFVYHNSRVCEGIVSDNQTGLKYYEVRIHVGQRGARVLNIATKDVVIHEAHIEFDEDEVANP